MSTSSSSLSTNHDDVDSYNGDEVGGIDHSSYFQEDDIQGYKNRCENDTITNVNGNFSTDTVFSSRQNLIDWVQSVGRSLGYVIVIKRSTISSIGKSPRVSFQCDRGGKYKSTKLSTRNTGTKRIGCPFRIDGKFLRNGDCWWLKVICETHNHEPSLHMEGHPYPRRLSDNEVSLVEDLSRKCVKPRAILSTLKKQNQDNVSTIKTIYNTRHKLRMIEKAGRTQMQMVMSFLQQENYIFESNINSSTNELKDLFFAHPKSLEIWHAFPHVLLIDATYQTNRFKMPLLEIIGVTSTNLTFCIAFVFMHKEKEANYTWALECLMSVMDGCIAPRVIVTDRELALMNACNKVFPEAKGLLYRWHINRNILKKCKARLTSRNSWKSFFKSWTKLVESTTEDIYMCNLENLEATLLDFPGILAYLNDYWLIPYKEMFVSAWIDKFLNFGNHTTNRVESQHAKLKRFLETTQADLNSSLLYIHQVVESQVVAIKASLEQSKIVIKHRSNAPHFRELHGFVAISAIDIMLKEFKRSEFVGVFSESCGCLLRSSHGLPCAHEQEIYRSQGLLIPLDSVDNFWRKLDLSPCISLKDGDFNCEFELEMFNSQFKKQSRPGKFSILRKLREIIAPSTTSVREPAIHTTTRGRPSFKKTLVDPPALSKERNRLSCSSMSRPVKMNDPQFVEPARHSYSMDQRYSSHPYINQFPIVLHPYITDVQDVRSDGNCGFRPVAVCLGLPEDEWPTLRRELMEELNMYKTEYLVMFGAREWFKVFNSLNFFELDRCAPYQHWMSMPEMGVLIASKYNVILHVLSPRDSMTHFPLRSSPPPWYQHVNIAMGHVNHNHYINVTLRGGYPMPTMMPQWAYFRYVCAAGWATPYATRINNYEGYLRNNCNTEFVILE